MIYNTSENQKTKEEKKEELQKEIISYGIITLVYKGKVLFHENHICMGNREDFSMKIDKPSDVQSIQEVD